jgi:Uri superfamily endonuclease
VKIPADPGSYILVGWVDDDFLLASGPFSGQRISSGNYLYSGSAYGPGGLRSRINRHLNPDTKKFWHFDHLKNDLSIEEIWYSTSPKNQECGFIKVILEIDEISFPILGFGSSDCHERCPAHLAKFPLNINIDLVFNNLITRGFDLQKLSLE